MSAAIAKGRSRARWAQIALLVIAVIDAVAIGSDIAEYRLLGTEYTIEQADANDLRQQIIGLVQLLLLVLGAVLFIRWFKRAYENVDRLGGVRRYSPRWAIWGWFVPFLSLWRPKQIANDIWRADNDGDDRGVSPLLTVWWAAFLVSIWASQVTLRLTLRAETIDELRTAAAAYVVADSVDLVAAVLAIFVVRAITARQAEAGDAPEHRHVSRQESNNLDVATPNETPLADRIGRYTRGKESGSTGGTSNR